MRHNIEWIVCIAILGISLDIMTSQEHSPFALYRRVNFEVQVQNNPITVSDLGKYVSKLAGPKPESIKVVLLPPCSSCSITTAAIDRLLEQSSTDQLLVFTDNMTALKQKFGHLGVNTLVFNLDDSSNSLAMRSNGPGIFDYNIRSHVLTPSRLTK